MHKEVESALSTKRKDKDPYDIWRFYDTQSSFKDHSSEPSADPKESKKHHLVDTIETLSPPVAASVAAPIESHQPVEVKSTSYSVSGIIDLGKKIWDYFCAPIAIKRDSSGTTGKPAGDSIQPIGGSPALTTPEILIDKEMLEKLIKELKEQFQHITETLNESDEQLREDERRILKCFLQQMKIKEEGLDTLKFLLIFDQQNDRKIRKENYNYEGEILQLNEKQKFWGAATTTFGAIATALIVASAAASFFATGGATVVPTVITGFKFTASILAGSSKVMKAHLDFDVSAREGKTVKLRQLHVHIDFRIRDELNLMKTGIEQVQKSVEMRQQVTKSMHDTARAVLK